MVKPDSPGGTASPEPRAFPAGEYQHKRSGRTCLVHPRVPGPKEGARYENLENDFRPRHAASRGLRPSSMVIAPPYFGRPPVPGA